MRRGLTGPSLTGLRLDHCLKAIAREGGHSLAERNPRLVSFSGQSGAFYSGVTP